MSNFISKELLTDIRRKSGFQSVLNESISAHQRSASSNEISVFLSHKHSDKPILENVIALLKGLGVYVYVDWNDDGMPSITSGYTAIRIKQKIRECKKFVLLATEDAIASKWCNWELGYGDAFRYRNDIAIMPITEKRTSGFSGSEYLQIYPVIKTEYMYVLGTYYVEFNGEKVKLVDWLKR